MNKVLVDANILMEQYFRRAKVEQVMYVMRNMSDDTVFITTILAASIFLYYVERRHAPKFSAHDLVAAYDVLDMRSEDYDWARDNDAGDFEDALQIACARRHGCRQFMTLDTDVAGMYGSFITVTTVA